MTTTPDEPYEPTTDPGGGPGQAAATAAAGGAAEARESAVLAEAADVLEDVTDPEDEAAMDNLDSPRRLLLVHAHPDDETIATGVTMAKYVATGAHVTLVTCTLGEEGEVLVPELEHLAADRDGGLGQHRVGELAAAMEALGVTDHRFLGGPGRYRDSGMMGTPANDHPDCFWRADVDEAASHLVEVIREVRPQVVVTYDENGGYGHPDHVQAHRVAMRAVELAGDEAYGPDVRQGAAQPWPVGKVYWNVVPRSVLQRGIEAMKEVDASFFGVESADELPFAAPDALVTTAVDGTEQVEAKLAGMRAHATQISVDGPFFALSNNIGLQVWSTEFYRCVRGEVVPDADNPDGHETDLFAGVA
jgi:N-acetyl-1-D-myo-inositol-2-amino-2-deoxy-alpha-D-glucopyranoside deacetylase